VRIEIERVEPAFEGCEFGDVGAYEKVVGRAFGTVDPAHPLNRVIVDLDHAPVNADGLVEYSTDFCLLKPVDTRRGNRRLLYDVLNRGNKVALHTLNDARRNLDGGMRIACNDPALASDAGHGFLMRRGYTILWSGWQGGGVPEGDGRMAVSLPIATNGGEPIVATSREEWVFEHMLDPVIAPLSYPANTLEGTLTVRQNERDPRVPVAHWRFLSPTQIEITRPAGFDASAIYELIYEARDPIVMGLGLVGIRDLVSYFRADNPLTTIDHAMAYGLSQAGRVLRDFLYFGLNETLNNTRVFDGVMACMAGSRKSFVNAPFAQPNRFSRQHEDRLFPGDQFPFTYATTTDPVSGRTDGILARCEASGTCPKIVQTESSTDFFQGRSSLVATDGRGGEVPIPDNVRLYHLAGVQHGGGGDPTMDFARMFPSGAYATNPADAATVHRALLVALEKWASEGEPPPPSHYPSPDDSTLVPSWPGTYGFPAIPGVTYPGLANELSALDYGVQPPQPVPGHDYLVLVPAIDADGNEISGLRVPDIAVPRGTHTGWTARREGHAPGELGSTGAFFPFAATRQERLASGDPRLSLEERYPTQDDYVRKVTEAAQDLAARGLLLDEDVERIVEAAKRQ
jgi:hypothetical protein